MTGMAFFVVGDITWKYRRNITHKLLWHILTYPVIAITLSLCICNFLFLQPMSPSTLPYAVHGVYNVLVTIYTSLHPVFIPELVQ